MIRKALLMQNEKRKRLIIKYKLKRTKLIKELKTRKFGPILFETTIMLITKLNKIPRNSIQCRFRNRCWKTGRPRGYLKFFGLCRNSLRDFANQCLLPGLTKASW